MLQVIYESYDKEMHITVVDLTDATVVCVFSCPLTQPKNSLFPHNNPTDAHTITIQPYPVPNTLINKDTLKCLFTPQKTHQR